MDRTFALVVVGMLAASGSSSAAEGGAPRLPKDREAVTYDEVERGFYVGVTAGGFFLVNPPVDTSRCPAGVTSSRPFSSGQMGQVEMGFDFGERLSVGLFVMGASNRAANDYIGKSCNSSNGAGPTASGDFSSFVPGLAARVNLLGMDDKQDVRRTWIYFRLGAGYAMFAPKALLPDADVLLFGGPGIEYYTRLRHFSLGLEVTGAYLATQGTFGFAITPNLRYAF